MMACDGARRLDALQQRRNWHTQSSSDPDVLRHSRIDFAALHPGELGDAHLSQVRDLVLA